jgi:hypothetical protein
LRIERGAGAWRGRTHVRGNSCHRNRGIDAGRAGRHPRPGPGDDPRQRHGRPESRPDCQRDQHRLSAGNRNQLGIHRHVTPLLFGDLDSVEILSDNTGESNTISIQSTGAVSARYVPSPSPPATIPPSGLSFFPFVAIGGQTKPASVTANGILADAQIQNLFFQDFGQVGVNFSSVTDPISGESIYLAPLPATGFTVGAQPTDAPSQVYSITWDANTSQYVGNFGLQIQAVPEPTALLIPAILLLLFRRRLYATT